MNLPNPASNLPRDDSVAGLALQWFDQMRAGQINRAQLSAEYSAHLRDEAVQGMSRFLNAYHYGVPPTGAKVVHARSAGDQAFYVVKFVFPRGDAASLLMGFNAEGKITGINLMGMAGD